MSSSADNDVYCPPYPCYNHVTPESPRLQRLCHAIHWTNKSWHVPQLLWIYSILRNFRDMTTDDGQTDVRQSTHIGPLRRTGNEQRRSHWFKFAKSELPLNWLFYKKTIHPTYRTSRPWAVANRFRQAVHSYCGLTSGTDALRRTPGKCLQETQHKVWTDSVMSLCCTCKRLGHLKNRGRLYIHIFFRSSSSKLKRNKKATTNKHQQRRKAIMHLGTTSTMVTNHK